MTFQGYFAFSWGLIWEGLFAFGFRRKNCWLLQNQWRRMGEERENFLQRRRERKKGERAKLFFFFFLFFFREKKRKFGIIILRFTKKFQPYKSKLT